MDFGSEQETSHQNQQSGMTQDTRRVWASSKNGLAADDDELRLASDVLRRPQDVFEVGALHIGAESARAHPVA